MLAQSECQVWQLTINSSKSQVLQLGNSKYGLIMTIVLKTLEGSLTHLKSQWLNEGTNVDATMTSQGKDQFVLNY